MAEIATLARPYARAAFEAAREDSGAGLEDFARMLRFLANAVRTPELASELEAPSRSARGKAKLLSDLAGDVLTEQGRNLVSVLAENNRLVLLGEIADQFQALKDEHERTLEVEVTSARELTDADLQRLRDGLAKRFDKEIDLSSRVDPDLLGGAVIQAGDTIIDGSVRGRLARLADALRVN